MDKQHIYDEFSDQELLHYLGQDDYRAFTTLYQRYIDVLFPYSRSLNLDEMDADDSIQEVFTHLWLRRSTLQIDNLSAWLFMSIRKQMLYQVRKKIYDQEAAKKTNTKISRRSLYSGGATPVGTLAGKTA